MGLEVRVRFGGDAVRDPDVLELRVHGVNNTTPAALLDLPPGDVRFVAGDKLGSFWAPTAQALADSRPGARGYVPKGITRQAYSWGGMVRTTPNFGGLGTAGQVAAVAARVLYALILPFSLANAAAWTRRLTVPGEGRVSAGLTAALARLFGLTLTLLYATTAAAISVDLVGAQCAATRGLCSPIQPLLDPLSSWTPAQRLALFSLVPVLAVAGLWVFSAFSRLRYDVLPGMTEHTEQPAPSRSAATAVLAQPGFWSNRITSLLARMHLACAVLLVCVLVASRMSGGRWWFTLITLAAAILLPLCMLLACCLPTMTITPVEARTARWPAVLSALALGCACALFAVLLALLAWLGGTRPPAPAPDQVGIVALILVATASAAALTGVVWRPFAGRAQTAWRGCAPAVFMTIALAVAVGWSAIVIVSTGNWLNARTAASALIAPHSAVRISPVWVAFGTAILTCAALAVVIVLMLAAFPRSLRQRAHAWRAPSSPRGEAPLVRPGVMPISPVLLYARVAAKRRTAARMHLLEPAAAVLALLLGLGILAGAGWAYLADSRGVPLWSVPFGDQAAQALRSWLDVALWCLGATGLALVAVLASGATARTPRPLGIVWDIACFLPRTGQPFGPPCFAQRAVPELAGRMFEWVGSGSRRTVVLVGHSMGAVLAVSALGLLASSPQTRDALDRIRLLTFGVQLRAYFGRMLPDLFGPLPLGTRPARAPGMLRRDPWRADFDAQRAQSASPPAAPDRLRGTLLAGWAVRWVNLWRLTDYLGFPAMSTAPASADDAFRNRVDRFAQEVDTTGYMVDIGTHSAYFRAPQYDVALRELAFGAGGGP